MDLNDKLLAYRIAQPIADRDSAARLKALSDEHDSLTPEQQIDWRANLAMALPMLFAEWNASGGESAS